MSDTALPNGQFVADETYADLLSKPDAGPLKSLEETAAALAASGSDGNEQPVEAAAEPAAAAAEPAAEAAPETKVEAPAAADDRIEKALATLADTVKKIDERIDARAAEVEEEPAGEVVPDDIRLLLESDDPRDQAIGRRLMEGEREKAELRARMDQRDAEAHEAAVERAADLYTQHIETVSAQCVPPLTEAEKDAVVAMLTDESRGTALARSLTFEQGVLLQLPGRLKTTAPATTEPAKPGSEGASRPVVRAGTQGQDKAAGIIGGGAAGPTPATVRQPPADETLEQAIARGARQLGLR